MGSVDFPAVISAAATSSLGVLSLIVLVISLLAYGFFRNAGETARLIVFAPLLLAAVAFGVSVMRESGRAQNAAAKQVATEPASGASAAHEPAVAAAESPSSPASAASSASVAGNWRDDEGFTYRLTTEGDHVRYRQFLDGRPVGSAEGTIAGHTLTYRYTDDRTRDQGTCKGLLSASGDAIDGHCSSGSNSWGFKIVRDAG